MARLLAQPTSSSGVSGTHGHVTHVGHKRPCHTRRSRTAVSHMCLHTRPCHTRRSHTSVSHTSVTHGRVTHVGHTRPCHTRRAHTAVSYTSVKHGRVTHVGHTRPCHTRRSHTAVSHRSFTHGIHSIYTSLFCYFLLFRHLLKGLDEMTSVLPLDV